MIDKIAPGAGVVSDRDYPRKPIRIITLEVGGSLNFVARLIAQGISGPLGQPVNVMNCEFDTGIELMKEAPADGHTFCVYGPALWTRPLVKKTPYDPLTDFSPITLATTSPLVVLVHPSVAATSIEELIALAKDRPAELKYVSGFNGATSQLAGALFTYMAEINMVCVPYRAGVSAFDDLIAGKVQMMIPSAGSGMPHVKLGKLRALAVASAKPSVLVPGLPTVAASGLPGYEIDSITAVWAPAKTPMTSIKRLNQEIVQFLKTAATEEQLLRAGLEVVGSTPEELTARLRSEMARLGKLIKEIGIRAA